MKTSKRAGGFPAGTRLQCCDGMIPVEFLDVGDRVISRDVGTVWIEQISPIVVDTHFIRFQSHALHEKSPVVEVLLPHDQLVLVRNWRAREIFWADRALVEAKDLVDHLLVEMTEKRKDVVFQITFSAPHIVYLEGIEVGSADAIPTRINARHPTAVEAPQHVSR